MYLSFYNVSEPPFAISTDPRFLWCGEKHQEGLANLKFGLLESNGYVVLTGDVGTGKTTLVNALIEGLNEKVILANINHPTLDTIDFFKIVAKTYDPLAEVGDKADFLLFLHSFLNKAYDDGKTVLLIIDEAHRLSEGLLEEIRLLSNMERAGSKLINIFFVGQDELKEILQTPQCRALRQRITLFYNIEPLCIEETKAYIEHRLKVAGAVRHLFTPDAIDEIQRFTLGYPRLINILCDRALMTGYVKEQKTIDSAIIGECTKEIEFHAPQKSAETTPLEKQSQHKARRPLPRPWDNLPAFVSSLNFRSHFPNATATLLVLFIIAAGISIYNKSSMLGDTSSPPDIAPGNVQGNGPSTNDSTRRVQQQDPEAPMGTEIEAAQAPQPKLRIYNQSSQKNGIPPSSNVAAASKPQENSPVIPTSTLTVQEQEPDIPIETEKAPSEPLNPTPLELATVALAQDDFQTVISLWEKNRDLDVPDNPALTKIYSQALVVSAQQLQQSAPSEAETLLRQAVEAYPQNSEAYYNLGKIYTRSQNYTQAIAAYQKSTELDPRLVDAFYNLGFIKAKIGMYEDAEEQFARVVQFNPAYVDKALFNLAVIQNKLGKKQESVANLQKAVLVKPDNERAMVLLKHLLTYQGESRP